VRERFRGVVGDAIMASALVAGALVVAGFAAMALAWRGAAATLDVPVQVPYLVSGGIGGLALLIAAATIVDVQVGRHLAARERAAFDAVVAEMRDRVRAGQIEILGSNSDAGSAVSADPKNQTKTSRASGSTNTTP